jgi:hypothetical protein
MRQTTPIISEIVRAGRVQVWTLPAIAALLARGLTPTDYEVLALVADQYRMTVAQLCALALEGVRR